MKDMKKQAPDLPISCKRLIAAESIGRKNSIQYKNDTANNDKLITSLSIINASIIGMVSMQKQNNQKN